MCEVISLSAPANRLEECWAYVRMSTDEQEDSPLTQGQQTEAFLQLHKPGNWTRTYFDLGISGKELAKRPGMTALLTDAERGGPACIVFYKLDRAFRNSFEQAAALRRLKKLGVKVYKVRDPNIDGPQGDMIDTVLGAVNQFERELTGLRIRDHNQAMAQRGEWPGGSPPYGYLYRKPVKETRNRKPITITPGAVEPHPAEWPIARQIWDWALLGQRKAEMLQCIAGAGYRKRNGSHWRFSDLDRFFDSKVYAGYIPFGHNGAGKRSHKAGGQGEWYHGQHTPMVTDDEWHRVQVLLRQGNLRQRSSRVPRMELAGLISCGICGAPATAAGTGKQGRYSYTCTNAATYSGAHAYWGRRSWVIHRAAQSVVLHIASILPSVPPRPDGSARLAGIDGEITRIERQLKRLRELYIIGDLADDLSAYQLRKVQLEAQLRAKRAELQQVGAPTDELKHLHLTLGNWGDSYAAFQGDVPALQRLWRVCVERIVVTRDLMRIVLVDLGPGIHRNWGVELPPLGSREPGSLHHGGVVGQPKGKRGQAWKFRPYQLGEGDRGIAQ